MATRRPLVVVNGVTSELPSGDTTPTNSVAPGTARQLLQTNAGGTATEWTSNVDVPGTLDVTSTATFDSIAQYPAGSAGAPTITFTGDTNTGIYSPGADQVAISTNGTGRVFIESNGRLGVGVSNPAFPFQVNGSACVAGSSDNIFLGVDDNTSPRLGLVKQAASAPIFAAGSATAFVFAHSSGTSISSPSTQTYTERMRLDSSGRLGVGVSAPATTLDSVGASGRHARIGGFQFAGTSATADAGNNLLSSGAYWNGTNFTATQASSATIQLGNGALNFYTESGLTAGNTYTGNVRMSLDSSGRLGIGTASPSRQLDVNSTAIFDSNGNGTTTNPSIAIGSTGVGFSYIGSQQLAFLTNSTERVRIDSSGRVGIGTSSVDRLFIASDSVDNNLPCAVITKAVTGGANSGLQVHTAGTDAGAGAYCFRVTAGNTYGSPTSEYLRVTAGGRVGVGTTSPTKALDVTGSIPVLLLSNTEADSTIKYTGIASRQFASSAEPEGYSLIGAEALSNNNNVIIGGGFSETNAATIIRFNVASTVSTRTGTEAARIDSSGRLLVGTSSAPTVGDSQYGLIRIQGNTSSASGFGVFSIGRGQAPASIVANSELGHIYFTANDGSPYASVSAYSDAAGGTNDYPGRIVLSTTADGAASPTERLRITNDGVRGYNQSAPVAVDTTATLTVANLKTGIITSTTAAAVTMTLPTGTLTEGGFSGLYNNFTFEWTVINTGATNAVTVQGGTGHTLVGSETVAAGVSGRFASRRTAANTFVTYRLS